MKKKIFLLFLLNFVLIGCSKNDDTVDPDPVFELEATGTVADQTPEEARKTINGKWTVGGASGKSFVSKGQNCTFIGIEFTDDRYAITIGVTGEDDPEFAYGSYQLTEASDGTVESIDLYENVDGANIKIATLTNVVVEKSGNDLRATFDVVFNIPDNYEDWPYGNSLSGDYAAEKESPVDGAGDADPDSNMALLVNTWTATSYSDSEGATLDLAFQAICYSQIEDILNELIEANGEEIAQLIERAYNEFIETNGADALTQEVMDAIAQAISGEFAEGLTQTAIQQVQEECDPAARLELSFSAYGSYTFAYFAQDGSVIDVDIDAWEFNNAAQTEILVGEGEDQFIVTIETLNETTFIGTIDDGKDSPKPTHSPDQTKVFYI